MVDNHVPDAPAPRKVCLNLIYPYCIPDMQAQKTSAPRGKLDPTWQHASHLRNPQLSFKKKVDNNNDLPWYPTLPHKYNAQVPLGYHYYDSEGNIGAENITAYVISSRRHCLTEMSEIVTRNAHPYRYEIRHISYPPQMFTSSPPIPPKSFADTPFNWVAAPSEFRVMLEKLRKAPEIAVDMEHHSYRSFSGFVCLMQISTREEDWVVDTLLLREELGELNEVFTDPGIVKVLLPDFCSIPEI
jgi:exosome complex exonuclease RRP6